jgi:hypothetical protein
MTKGANAKEHPMTELPKDVPTQIAILVQGAILAGAREAQLITDSESKPATVTECGTRLRLVRVIDETRKGFDQIDALLLGNEDDDDGEVRIGSGDRLFSLHEHGPEPPELEVHNRDVNAWLPTALLALALKCAPDDVAGARLS